MKWPARKKNWQSWCCENVNSKKISRILRTLSKDIKATKIPLLSKDDKGTHVSQVKQYMETKFSIVIFKDECRAISGGTGVWARGCVLHGNSPPAPEDNSGRWKHVRD